jgi:uncharacterized FlgJ-related protein
MLFLQTKDLKFRPIDGCGVLLVFGLICLGNFLTGYKMAEQVTINKIEVIDTAYIATDTLPFTEANLKALLKAYNVWYPEVALKQARVESANYSSQIYKENNNLFGFRVHPGRWQGVEMPFTNRGHLVFTHWTKSVQQYKLWQQANYNKETYLKFLHRVGYAEDPTYINKLR